MNFTTIIIIICAVVFGIAILFFSFIAMSNANKSKKLNKNLKKIKDERKDIDKVKPTVVNISNDEIFSTSDNDKKSDGEDVKEENSQEEKKPEPVIEEYLTDSDDDDDDFERMLRRHNRRRGRVNRRVPSEKVSKDDDDDGFEEFMKQHAYSRKILNEELVEKLRSLPPEMQKALLENITTKYDD